MKIDIILMFKFMFEDKFKTPNRSSYILLTCEVLFLVLTVIFMCLNFKLIYSISFIVFLFSGILGMFSCSTIR